jgi:mannosyltransferase OCH1-like enzyme
MTATTLLNTADWHATMALKSYRKRAYDDYRYHIFKADLLRSLVF